MIAAPDISGYHYRDTQCSGAHSYLLPAVTKILERHFLATKTSRRVFDVGCGNGAVVAYLDAMGYSVTGVDPSTEGIEQARKEFPTLAIEQGSAYDDLRSRFGEFPAVISLEVVEHVYAPRIYAKTIHDLVEPGGIAVISTPYHGYLKNLTVAVFNGFDKHVSPLWDHGHIKFWSRRTLTQLLRESGFSSISFVRVGRVPPLAKSMIAVGRKA
jgi:2-polyprenyl-6-hydroxyphenyl methylase/3-demethylubiquinone-9 3-methyltransferase